MKRWIWLVAILLLATPLLAQEEGGGGLPSSLFGGGDFGARGEQPKPMDAVKKFFTQANMAISGDQEKAIKPIVETAFKQVQDTVERLSGQPGAGGERGARGQGGERRGGGGAGGGGGEPGQRRGRGGQAGGNPGNNPQ